jgi:DNA-nicking Smr family endonuclease
VSKKHRGTGREEPPPNGKLPEAAKLTNPALARGLGALKQAMETEARAKAAAEAEKRRAAEARGEIVGPAKKKPAATPAPAGAKRAQPEVWRPDLEKELFNVAMSGVTPLAGRGERERVRQGAAAEVNARPRVQAPSASTKMRRAQAEGDDGLAVRWSEDGGCEAARRGRAFALEALGRFAVPQDTLDLHGRDAAEAHSAVAEFVRARRARGMRTVRVVHGIGRHAPDGTSLLREAVVRALSEPPGSREVDAFRTADAENGGPGALMVALRQG